jgi:dephospho-CoA kinase
MQLTRRYYHAAERMQHDREAFKFIKCDYVIDNSGNVKNAIDQIKKLLND